MIKCNIQLHVIFHVNIWLIFFFYSGLRNWIGKFQKCYNYSLKVAKSWYCSLKKKNMLKLYACIIELNYSGGVSCLRILTSLFDQSDVVKYPIPTDYNGHDIETWNLYL